MKQLVLFLFALCLQTTVIAQNYTDHLQRKVQGQGTVTISQSKEIDDLVNGKIQVVPQNQTTTKTNANANNNKPKTDNAQNLTNQNNEKTEEEKREELAQKERDEQIRREKEELARKIAEQRLQEAEENGEGNGIDTSKKVMRQSYKINGYRVQAYLGGNSRSDREKAQQVGNAIKKKYPLEPIYVHFYSPRWTCRVGNYRTYEDAKKMLDNVKKMGYKEATILKGKITVQY